MAWGLLGDGLGWINHNSLFSFIAGFIIRNLAMSTTCSIKERQSVEVSPLRLESAEVGLLRVQSAEVGLLRLESAEVGLLRLESAEVGPYGLHWRLW